MDLIQLSSEQKGTENFPVHVAHAHAHELFCSIPVRGKFSLSRNAPLGKSKSTLIRYDANL